MLLPAPATQPPAPVVLAKQHHRRPFGAGELREKFRLPDERLAGVQDGLLIDRRRHQRVQFMPQAARFPPPSLSHHATAALAARPAKPGNQVGRQGVRQGIVNEEAAFGVGTGVRLEGKFQAQALVPFVQHATIADQQKARVRADCGSAASAFNVTSGPMPVMFCRVKKCRSSQPYPCPAASQPMGPATAVKIPAPTFFARNFLIHASARRFHSSSLS